MFRMSIKFEEHNLLTPEICQNNTTEYVVYRRLVSHGALEEFGVLMLIQVANSNMPLIGNCIVKGETEFNISGKEWFEHFFIFIY